MRVGGEDYEPVEAYTLLPGKPTGSQPSYTGKLSFPDPFLEVLHHLYSSFKFLKDITKPLPRKAGNVFPSETVGVRDGVGGVLCYRGEDSSSVNFLTKIFQPGLAVLSSSLCSQLVQRSVFSSSRKQSSLLSSFFTKQKTPHSRSFSLGGEERIRTSGTV
jgi:hypothetical protein